jgi:hypothetical protein
MCPIGAQLRSLAAGVGTGDLHWGNDAFPRDPSLTELKPFAASVSAGQLYCGNDALAQFPILAELAALAADRGTGEFHRRDITFREEEVHAIARAHAACRLAWKGHVLRSITFVQSRARPAGDDEKSEAGDTSKQHAQPHSCALVTPQIYWISHVDKYT